MFRARGEMPGIPELHRVVVALDLGGVEAFAQRHAERYLVA
jgi:hypothetical protein